MIEKPAIILTGNFHCNMSPYFRGNGHFGI